MKPLPTAIVLPCLNEEETLPTTCRSLGFGMGPRGSAGGHLVIVDNGSSDQTLAIAEAIKADSPPGSVTVGHERERGYVPPRHKGVGLIRDVARTAGWEDVLILQADADTTYGPGYVENFATAAAAVGSNVLLEAAAEFPPEFRSAHPEFVSLCASIDTQVLHQLALPDSHDLICNDSVCAYRLSDYAMWGGHLREYTAAGDEIHAETTRLFMRSLANGSRKVLVPDAVGYQSARKSLLRPHEEFATAGFPREERWRETWRAHYESGTRESGVSLISPGHPKFDDAIRGRKRHLVAIFGLLPFHVFRALGHASADLCTAELRQAAAGLPMRDKETLFRRPGLFIEDVLTVVDGPELLLPNP